MIRSSCVKLWALTILTLLFLVYSSLMYWERLSVFEKVMAPFFFLLPIIATILVTSYNKKTGVLYWISALIIPKCITLTTCWISWILLQGNIDGVGVLYITVFLLAYCMLLCRLFLQWTAPTWKNQDQVLSEKQSKSKNIFWKIYLSIEMLSIMAFLILFLTPVVGANGANILFPMVILGVCLVYNRYVEKTCFSILAPRMVLKSGITASK